MDTRRRNLKSLVERFDTQSKAAEACGLTAASMSRLINGAEAMGNKRARQIEKRMELPEGWMDTDRMDDRFQWIETYRSALAGGHDIEEATAAADELMSRVAARFEA